MCAALKDRDNVLANRDRETDPSAPRGRGRGRGGRGGREYDRHSATGRVYVSVFIGQSLTMIEILRKLRIKAGATNRHHGNQLNRSLKPTATTKRRTPMNRLLFLKRLSSRNRSRNLKGNLRKRKNKRLPMMNGLPPERNPTSPPKLGNPTNPSGKAQPLS
jgi:hypothetical protein